MTSFPSNSSGARPNIDRERDGSVSSRRAPQRLIAGCGFLGLRVARRWLAAGNRVVAISRSAEGAAALTAEGIQPIVGDVTAAPSLPTLPAVDTLLYAVGWDGMSGASRRAVYVEGLENVLRKLPRAPRRIVLISSTGVYGDHGEGIVDEASPCRPTRESGQALLEAEERLAVHAWGDRRIVLRMAGLYGIGRLPRSGDLEAPGPLAVAAERWLNLIQVDDAADVVVAAAEHIAAPARYVVSDGCPVRKRDFLREMARLLGRRAPEFVDQKDEPTDPAAEGIAGAVAAPAGAGAAFVGGRRGSKRVDSRRVWQTLGISPRFPTFREGLGAALAAERD